MILNVFMDDVEGEEVARQAERNRELTQIGANFGERDRPCRAEARRRRIGRRGVRLAPRSGWKRTNRDVFGETPNTATETVALPKHRILEHSCLFESIRGSIRKS